MTIRKLAKRYCSQKDKSAILEAMVKEFPPHKKLPGDPWGTFLHYLFVFSPDKKSFTQRATAVEQWLAK